MNHKQRVYAALEGRWLDRYPVTALYNQLYRLDHFYELTGLAQWRWQEWLHAPPEQYLHWFRVMHELAPFELLQPDRAPARRIRERIQFIEIDGRPFQRDRVTGALTPLHPPRSGHAFDDRINTTQYVFDRQDVDERVKVIGAERLIADGLNDYIEAVVAAYGADHFILSGGVAGSLYMCSEHVGLLNLLAMLVEQPTLIDYLCQRTLEQNIETVRQLAAAGGDGIYVDDAFAGCDMISVAHYERFCLPYTQELVREIHRLNHKAIVIYYGGIADRLDQVVATGADGLQMEASMKGYVNDIRQTVERIGRKITLFGNLHPIRVLQNGSDEELQAEILRQVTAGRLGRGFIIATGSPITPATPLARVQRFLELGRRLGCPYPGHGCAGQSSCGG